MPLPIRPSHGVFVFIACAVASCGGSTPARSTGVAPPLASITRSTDCSEDAASLYARLPFDRLALGPTHAPQWPDDAELRRCLTIDAGDRTFTILAAFALSEAVWTNHVIVGLFEGDRVLDATLLAAPDDVGVEVNGSCAEALGFGPSREVRVLALEPETSDISPIVRVEVARDVCGVACGTRSRDVTLLTTHYGRLGAVVESVRTLRESYVVSNEEAESYDCDEGVAIDRTVTMAGGFVRVCNRADPPTCALGRYDR